MEVTPTPSHYHCLRVERLDAWLSGSPTEDHAAHNLASPAMMVQTQLLAPAVNGAGSLTWGASQLQDPSPSLRNIEQWEMCPLPFLTHVCDIENVPGCLLEIMATAVGPARLGIWMVSLLLAGDAEYHK